MKYKLRFFYTFVLAIILLSFPGDAHAAFHLGLIRQMIERVQSK